MHLESFRITLPRSSAPPAATLCQQADRRDDFGSEAKVRPLHKRLTDVSGLISCGILPMLVCVEDNCVKYLRGKGYFFKFFFPALSSSCIYCRISWISAWTWLHLTTFLCRVSPVSPLIACFAGRHSSASLIALILLRKTSTSESSCVNWLLPFTECSSDIEGKKGTKTYK